jgi:hypothetical protein
MRNSFFSQNEYENEIGLEINEDVLERIYADNITSKDLLNINFAFITDTIDKAKNFAKILAQTFTRYKDIAVDNYNDLFEITGTTDKIQMSISEINKWNQTLWDFGYKYDCKLDGWFVEGN